jgi:two-component system sensor histidine kinase KdpD
VRLTGRLRALARAPREARELREQAARRAEFTAAVAHDLRTPLASILGSVQTLRQRAAELAPAQRDALLDVIAREGERLAKLVDDVFDSARIDADGFVYSFSDVDVGEVVAEAVAAASAAGASGVVHHVEPGLPPVRADRARVRQVLANLVDNAVKFSPPGSPVDVTAKAAGGGVVVEVTDRGPGIAPAEQERIFERLARVPGTPQPGTGLGLHIARTIAEAHGGTLRVDSTPGDGATFSLTLPRAGG